MAFPILQEQRCETGDAEVTPSDITVGGQANIMFDVYNTGKTTLYNVWVKFEGESITGGDSFLGTISSGATGSVDAMVTGAAATMDDGKIKVVISYENESGVVSTVEKELELFVMEEMMGEFTDDMMGIEGDMGDMGEMEGGGKKFILPIVLAVIVLAIAGIIIFRIRRKKKKEQEELKAGYTRDLEAVRNTCDQKLEETRTENIRQIEEMKREYASQLEEIKSEHVRQVEEMRQEHVKELEEAKNKETSQLEEVKSGYIRQLQAVRDECARQMEEAKAECTRQIEEAKNGYLKQAEQIKAGCEREQEALRWKIKEERDRQRQKISGLRGELDRLVGRIMALKDKVNSAIEN